ncbi:MULTISPECIES: 3-methyl-2-oxobutanoate hydroxymethyltransferase [unclassified Arthrobacter]|uniref:3-methyl-2-oxobutanoate hydroxymethyltransferase n=1 Tax=unclassified Arthrobacter TaxID=235627 RepID=UPI002105C767|nr:MULTISPECIES: 3-methyl-2-oxobutanoate hydroxymethyltransferase [unclassified Arthrobacter]MCQ1946603.1 3-methyl-2-oxobutanoate hydroxymethyltransferase [Arthrobacter sp. zg-Y1116]MCQ1987262.1 3-methyl-2-oxobutanoate hydroxymethyltransferase [Arthrobacter sp. zg-Y844]MCQ1995925.1 3-methyl-2-oxobutanoate hydroxymethyltransferase [Arthrobacter sp. zg-Y1171]UWX82996.1 3-methyl-2-oxobutanoate hydroxymethyltransferase [Arthrobacter sp. zg-Y1171]
MTSAEQPSPYAANPADPSVPEAPALKKIRISHLQQLKDNGGRFAMLTAYDQYAAGIFDEAGIEVLLVGDSAANNVMGHATTLPITMDEMIVFARSVTAGASHSLVVCDLPFGSYEVSPAQAIESSVRLMKEGLVHAVKMEGGRHYVDHVRAMTAAGIPVMAHVGFTPQAEHALGGYKVQGRGDAGAAVVQDAVALAEAGAFCVLMEMVPADVAAEVDAAVRVPTIGIGAGNATTGQVLVWQDMAGLRGGKQPRFVKAFADLRTELSRAAKEYAAEVRSGSFPGPEHSF